MKGKLFAAIIVFALVASAFTQLADAKTYHWKGSVYVDDHYRYVGYTPQRIVIKTMALWWHSPFQYEHNTNALPGGLKIKIYSHPGWGWWHWHVKQYTFYSGYIHAYSWYRHWYDRFLNKPRVMFVIKLPKTKRLVFPSSGWNRIEVSTKLTITYYLNGYQQDTVYLSGRSNVYIHRPSWSAYRRYWGISTLSLQSLEQSGYHIDGYSSGIPPDSLYVSSVNETGQGTINIQFSTSDVAEQTQYSNYYILPIAVAFVAITFIGIMIAFMKKGRH